MTDDTFDQPETGEPGAVSATARAIEALALYGAASRHDEPDTRPAPEPHVIDGALAQIFDALAVLCTDTILEPDLAELMWAAVNGLHRRGAFVSRLLDGNEAAQRSSQGEQDGSEVRSVELERLVAEGRALVERRAGLDTVRDAAAELFRVHTGSAWRPRTGSHVSRRALTADEHGSLPERVCA